MTSRKSGNFCRILVTGGMGFVGSHLLPKLVTAYPQALGTVWIGPPLPGEREIGRGWKAQACDLTDRSAVREALADVKPDLIVHLAAQSSVATSGSDGAGTWDVNFGGTYSLARNCASLGLAPVFFFVSSAETYGRSLNDGPATESTPLQPLNCYARSKAAAESVLLDVLPSEAQLIVARPFNHTGRGQDRRFVLPSFAAQIAEIEAGRRPPVLEVGNLHVARDFLDVGDVCDAYVRLIAGALEMSARETFNVCSGIPYEIGNLLDILRSKAKCEFSYVVDPARARPSEVPVAVGVNQKLRDFSGWAPSTPIDSILDTLLLEARARVAGAPVMRMDS